MLLALLLSCSLVTQRQVRVDAERGDLGAALSQACAAWFDPLEDAASFDRGERAWYVPNAPATSFENTWAWGTRSLPRFAYHAEDLRGWVRPHVRGRVELKAWSAEEIMAELCPGGAPERFCRESRVPQGYGVSHVFIELTTWGLEGPAGPIQPRGVSAAIEGQLLEPASNLLGHHVNTRKRDSDALAEVPPPPPLRAGHAGAPEGLGLIFETVLTGGLNLVIRGGAGTMNADPGEPAPYDPEHPYAIAVRELDALQERERAFYEGRVGESCEGPRCAFKLHLARDGSSPAGGPDVVHLTMSHRFDGCHLADRVELPIPEGASLDQRLDGMAFTLPSAEVRWPEWTDL